MGLPLKKRINSVWAPFMHKTLLLLIVDIANQSPISSIELQYFSTQQSRQPWLIRHLWSKLSHKNKSLMPILLTTLHKKLKEYLLLNEWMLWLTYQFSQIWTHWSYFLEDHRISESYDLISLQSSLESKLSNSQHCISYTPHEKKFSSF